MNPARSFIVSPGMGVLIADAGIVPGNVLRRAGLPGDLFSRQQMALSPQEYFRLWEALEAEADDPTLPLRFAEVLSLEVFDPPIFAAVCSPDLNVAAHRIAEYKKLIGPMRLSVLQTGARTTLELEWPEGMTPPPILAAAELVFWVALARLATRVQVRPLGIAASQPLADPAAYREYFGVTPRVGSKEIVEFSAHDATLPFVTANERMWEFFEPQLRKRLSELDVGAAVADRVRGALFELLPSGNPTMGAVAKALAVSTRTLQRRLRGEGTTFQSVLGQVREELARHYLTSSGLSTTEISFLLGYEEPNSFYRAFRGWTGETPDAVRSATT